MRGLARMGALAMAFAMVAGPAWGQVRGDFNGDGYADLAIGVPGENVGGQSDAGAVHVLYGSPGGLQATGVAGPNDQLWSRDSPGIGGFAVAGDEFGSALAVGDFNGDGYADLAIGVPKWFKSRGAVFVLHGSPAGLQATGIGGPDDQRWSQQSPGVQGKPERDDLFGWSLAAGDFDGDGRADLAIGVPGENRVNGANPVGIVQVLYGSQDGLQASGRPAAQLWSQGSPGVEGSAEHGDRFGAALAAGDFDGDGRADLAIGVPYETLGTELYAGAVHVLHGSGSGLQATGTGGPASQLWTADRTNVFDTAAWSLFGEALAAGDFDGDGRADLAIAAPWAGSPNPQWGAAGHGVVTVLFGWSQGLQAAGTGDARDAQGFTQLVKGIEGYPQPGDLFGWSLSVGDFNADSHADLAVGVPGESLGVGSAGIVHVIYGSYEGLNPEGNAAAPASQWWSQEETGAGAVEANDRFGTSLGAGDFNGDGYEDLVIGVPHESSARGAVHVIYGSYPVLDVAGFAPAQLWMQSTPGAANSPQPGDRFGIAFGSASLGAASR